MSRSAKCHVMEVKWITKSVVTFKVDCCGVCFNERIFHLICLNLSPQFTSFVSKNPDQAWIWQLEGSVASLSSSHVPSLCVLACQCPLVIPPLSHPSSPLCSSPSCLGQSGLTVRPMTAWIILPVSLAAFSITGIWIVWVSICCHP